MKKYTNTLLGVLLLAVLGAGCTSEKPQKLVLREDVLSKDLIEAVELEDPSNLSTRAERVAQTGTKYMFLPSVSQSDRKSYDTFPYLEGQEAMVKFEWTKESLRVLNIERDARFAENNVNFKPVLEIPVSHVDFKCVEDAYGDCTSNEKQNDEIESLARQYFIPKIGDTNVQMVTGLPLLNADGGGCSKSTGSRLVGYEFTKEAINIEIESTYATKLTWRCLSKMISTWEGLTDLSSTSRHFFSIVKLDNLKTPNYRPVEYSYTEERTFGFFNNEVITLDVDNSDVVQSEKMLLNRWAPGRTVTYYMNEAFNKPEYKKIKEATYYSVEAVNNALKAAGADLKVVLNEPVKDMAPGDLRNNMIVLVNDPQNARVLGYGPSIKNPETGEILKANTIMYLGTMKTSLSRDYDMIVKEKLAEQETLKQAKAPFTLANALKVKRPAATAAAEQPARDTATTTAPAETQLLQRGLQPIRGSIAQNAREFVSTQKPDFTSKDMLADLIRQEMDPTRKSDITSHMHADLQQLMSINAYPEELFNFRNAITEGVDIAVEKYGYRLWNELSDGEQAELIETLLPFVWIPTLIHEIGHNLGLRHNFGASEDKENFYTREELDAMGVKADWAYSSVMDYGYRATRELQTMGKYDIAALKYAYAEKLELTDGNEISLSEYQAAIRNKQEDTINLKPYQYCTDEHIGSNPNCNPFDEGSNFTEIALHALESMNHFYDRVHRRYNRRSFSLMSDYGALSYADRDLWKLRQMYERYETLKYRFNLADDDPIWEENEFLKDIRQAAIIGASQLVEIIRTPDTLCAVAQAAAPTVVTNLIPLNELSADDLSCFDVPLNPAYIMVAEAGKSFRSKKSSDNPNPYADQIDLRGIWMVKLQAAQYLFEREFNSTIFDDYTKNFLDLPEARVMIDELVEDILKDRFIASPEFRTKDGAVFKFDSDIAYTGYDASVIEQPLSGIMTYVLNLPNQKTNFRREFLQILARELPSIQNGMETQVFQDSFGVQFNITDIGRQSEYRSLRYNNRTYYALPENTYALEFMDEMETLMKLDKISRARLIEIYTGNGAPATGADEEFAANLPKTYLLGYLNGEKKSADYYGQLLYEMGESTVFGARLNYSPADLLVHFDREMDVQEVQTLMGR